MIASKILHRLFLLLIASTLVVACDSSEDDDEGMDVPDSERFIGNWAVTAAADMGGTRDQTAVFSGLGVLTVDLDDEGNFTLFLDYTDPETDDLMVSGPYSVVEASSQLNLTVSLNGITVPLPFLYEFVNDDTVELTTDATLLNLLLDAALEGDVVLTIARV